MGTHDSQPWVSSVSCSWLIVPSNCSFPRGCPLSNLVELRPVHVECGFWPTAPENSCAMSSLSTSSLLSALLHIFMPPVSYWVLVSNFSTQRDLGLVGSLAYCPEIASVQRARVMWQAFLPLVQGPEHVVSHCWPRKAQAGLHYPFPAREQVVRWLLMFCFRRHSAQDFQSAFPGHMWVPSSLTSTYFVNRIGFKRPLFFKFAFSDS